MAADTTSPKKSSPANLAWFFGVAAPCISLLLPISFIVWRKQLNGRVNADIGKISEAGLPVTGADLNIWTHPPSPTENGAAILKEGFALLHNFTNPPPGRASFSDILEDQAPESLAILTQYVETNRAALVKIEQGLKFKQFNYIPDYSPGFKLELPHLAKIREAANLFAAKAALDLAHNREREFVENTKQIISLAKTLDTEPIFISWVVRTATIQNAVRSTRRGLNRTELSANACDELSAAFQRAGSTNLLPAALIGERAMSLPIFRLSSTELFDYINGNDRREFGDHLGFKMAATLGVIDRDCREYLATIDQVIALSREPFPKSLTVTNLVEEKWRSGFKRGVWLTSFLLSSLEKSTTKAATLQVSLESVRTALALENFRRANPNYPESLNELAPQIPIPLDPFDGKPLRYQRTESGYILYSVDADGTDDHGAQFNKNQPRTGETYDLVFKVNRPKQPKTTR